MNIYKFGYCHSCLNLIFIIPSFHLTAMYDNLEGASQAGMQRPPLNPQPNPFGNAFSGPGSGLIRGGLGAYGEKIFGSSSEYVQSNVCTFTLWN